jgi:predicted HTH transcriptional regulator
MAQQLNEELKYLQKLISQGEHQQLDFKFAITDSRKIARSLVAFANSEGGTLLVGVKDNGKIAGIRSEEEIYMVDGAAVMYCKPQIQYKLRLWEPEEKKQVLEVIVEPDSSRLWKAQTEEGNWKVWLRSGDQNIPAGNVWEQVWKKRKNSDDRTIVFDRKEQLVFSHLTTGKYYSIDEIIRLTSLPLAETENLISDFIVMGLMKMHLTVPEVQFYVSQKLSI